MNNMPAEKIFQTYMDLIRKSDSAVSFSCGELLEKLFLETIRLPGAFSKFTVRLAVIHAIILLVQKFRDKDGCDLRIKSDTPDAYFSGYTNASKFSEVFKKNEGVLPKDWRK